MHPLSYGTFVCARVKFHGPTNYRGARYTATVEHDGISHRVTVPYDYAQPRNSVILAAKLAAVRSGVVVHNLIPIVGDLDESSYAVTFVSGI